MKPGGKHKVGVYSGPEITNDGLVLSLDAANLKGYDKYENLLQYSEDFSNAYWTKSNVSVTSNAIASPTGSSNASKLVESASTAVHELFRSDGALGVGSDTYITFSIFAKAAERQYCYIRSSGNSKRIAVVVDLSNGTFNVTNWGFTLNSSATVTPYPNGWYRITATAQSNYPQAPGWNGAFFVSPLDSYQSAGNVGGGGYSYAGNGTSGIYIWGAHYEFGPGISDYYATTGTAKTRGTTWTDLTGRGNNGTLTNGPTFSTANSGSIVFDGTNDYVTSSFATTSGQAVTYTGWLYSTETTATYRNFVDSVTARPMIWWNTSGQIEFDAAYYTTTAVYRNQWVYVALSKPSGSSSASYYVNGVLVGSGTAYTTPAVTPTWFNRASAQTWIGNCANVQVYNKALTAAEVQQNYNATKSRYGL
jgi:hypothetical protein